MFLRIFSSSFIKINSRSRCGQCFTNLAQQMNVLYPAEQKGWPLGSQALNIVHSVVILTGTSSIKESSKLVNCGMLHCSAVLQCSDL